MNFHLFFQTVSERCSFGSMFYLGFYKQGRGAAPFMSQSNIGLLSKKIEVGIFSFDFEHFKMI